MRILTVMKLKRDVGERKGDIGDTTGPGRMNLETGDGNDAPPPKYAALAGGRSEGETQKA
jgi:hypothetical protein